MGACLRILVPDATTNYILNPAFRYGTTGWTLFGAFGRLLRVSDYARFNTYSLYCNAPGFANREGVYYRVSSLVGISEPITASVYVRGTGKVHIRLIDNPAGKEWVGPTITLTPKRWIRTQVTGFSTGSDDMRLYVETADQIQNISFYIDGAQMERHPYATTYCDGDQPGCAWNLESHNSLSTRSAYTRKGGRWVEIGGPCRWNDNIYFTVLGGMGMAPIVNNVTLWPEAPGGYYQNSKVLDRVITLSFHTKNKKLISKGAPKLDALHGLRQQLIDMFKPDATMPEEPFLLEYTQGDRPIYFWAHYEGGLEGEWDIRNQWVNSFPVRLLCTEPFFFEDDQELYALDFQEWDYFNGVAARINGRWNKLNYGMLPNAGTADGPVVDFEFDQLGRLWACGSFRYANANAAAIDPMITPEGICYWDGTKWVKISAGANAVINDMTVAPNGYLYVTGAFTSIGGVAANGVAYWDGSAWNAMGTGISGVGGTTQGLAIKAAPNGHVYMGGNFTSVGGKNCRYVARWDGAGTWHTVGVTYGGFNAAVNSIVISKDGVYVYFAGDFTDQYSLAANALLRVAKYTVSTNAFSAMANGFNASVSEIILGIDSGVLHVCGAFTASGTTSINHVGMWNGTSWVPMGTGANGNVNSIASAPSGEIVAVGQFSQMNGIQMNGLAMWNGSTWMKMDAIVAFGTTPTLSAVEILPNGDIFIGGTSLSVTRTVTSLLAGITTVTNTGSAEVFPKVRIVGPAKLHYIENQTTGVRSTFNLQIMNGDEIYIDFETGDIVSLGLGDIDYSVIPGSEFHALPLSPGENTIALFMSNDSSGVLAQMYYTPRHWSADAVEVVEAL